MEGTAIPSKWNTWKVIEKIGDGTCSEVFHVRDHISNKDAALKIITIRKTALSEENFIVDKGLGDLVESMPSMDDVLFRRKIENAKSEIDLLYKLKGQKNIVTIYDHDFVEEDTQAQIYMLLEYLEDLWNWFDIHLLTEERIIDLGIQMCKALEYCEDKNIYHQDIKPENILVARNGTYKLTDFSVSGSPSDGNGSSAPQGTLLYMAPETIIGKGYTKRSEVYALGLVLYQLSNGKCLPFMDPDKGVYIEQDFRNTIEARCQGTALPKPSEVSEDTGKVITTACAFDEIKRYPSVIEFRHALENLLKGKGAQGKPITLTYAYGDTTGRSASADDIALGSGKADSHNADGESVKADSYDTAGGTEPIYSYDAGKPVNNGNKTDEQANKNRKKSSGGLKIGILAAAVIAVIGVAFFALSGRKTKNELPELEQVALSVSAQEPEEKTPITASSEAPETKSVSSSSETAEPDSAVTTGHTFEKKDQYLVGDYIFDKDCKISFVESGVYESPDPFTQPADGYQYISCTFLIENLSETDVHQSSEADYCCYADGEYCSKVNIGTTDYADITPGRAFRAVLVYEVPVNAKTVTVSYSAQNDPSLNVLTFLYEGIKQSSFTEESHRIKTEDSISSGTAADLSGLSITVRDVNENVQEESDFEAKEGYHYVSVSYRIENTGNSVCEMAPRYFPLYADGYFYNYSDHYTDLSASIPAGTSAECTITYEVPDGADCLEADYFDENALYESTCRCTFSL